MALHTLWDDSQTAAFPNESDGGASGVTYSTGFIVGSDAGTVLGVRFLATSTIGAGETYTAGLWRLTDNTTGNVELATKTVSSAAVSAGSWNSILFDAPVAIDSSHAYKAGIWQSAGRYVFTALYFASVGLGDRATLYAWASLHGAGETVPGVAGTVVNSTWHLNAAFSYPADNLTGAALFVSPVWDDGISAVPTTIALGRINETDTMRPLALTKTIALGRITTTTTMRGLTVTTPAAADLDITVGRPRTAWTVGSPRTAWDVDRPQTNWTIGRPR